MKEMGQYMHLALQQDAEGLSHPLPRPNNVTADASRIRDVLVVDSNGLEQRRDPGICSPSAQRDEVGEIPRLLPRIPIPDFWQQLRILPSTAVCIPCIQLH